MSKTEITNSQVVIDSRDVIERIEQLADEIAEIEGDDFDGSKVGGPDDPVDADLRDEKAKLESLQSEAEGYSEDWPHGSTMIRESYFVEAMQELCADIGVIPKEMPSYLVIDWDATASSLKADYTEVDFDGVTYLIR